jgi:hypothetical protein
VGLTALAFRLAMRHHALRAMSDVHQNPTLPADATLASTRQPLSLRELGCLVTLAAVTCALLTYRVWDRHERWLLGLTLGGTLVAILAARGLGRRVWLAGMSLGLLGGVIALGIIGRDWLVSLEEYAAGGAPSAADVAEMRNDYLASAAATLAVALLLSALAIGCFHAAMRATATGQPSLVFTLRHHPRWSAAVAVGIAIGALVFAKLEYLVSPGSWAPSDFISLEHIERPIFTNHGVYTVRAGSLSHSGNWLMIETYMPGIGRETSKKELYRLDPRPQRVSFPEPMDRVSLYSFACDSDRIIYLRWLGEPRGDRRLQITDLENNTSETLVQRPSDSDVHSLQCLPDQSLVIYYGDEWNGKKGHTRLSRVDGWLQQMESDDVATFDPRSNLRLEFGQHEVRIVDVPTSQTIARFGLPWIDEMGVSRIEQLEISPNGRFILGASRVYDRESNTITDWDAGEFPSSVLFGFTNQSQVLCYDYEAATLRGRAMSILWDVPLAKRVVKWLHRAPLYLLDVQTGQEIARTQRLPTFPTDVVFARDGSRMAVFTDDGVYLYDVPAEFR